MAPEDYNKKQAIRKASLMRTVWGVKPTFQTLICFLVERSLQNATALAEANVSSIHGREFNNISGFQEYWQTVSFSQTLLSHCGRRLDAVPILFSCYVYKPKFSPIFCQTKRSPATDTFRMQIGTNDRPAPIATTAHSSPTFNAGTHVGAPFSHGLPPSTHSTSASIGK